MFRRRNLQGVVGGRGKHRCYRYKTSRYAHRVDAAKPQVRDHEEELVIVAVSHAICHPLHSEQHGAQSFRPLCKKRCSPWAEQSLDCTPAHKPHSPASPRLTALSSKGNRSGWEASAIGRVRDRYAPGSGDPSARHTWRRCGSDAPAAASDSCKGRRSAAPAAQPRSPCVGGSVSSGVLSAGVALQQHMPGSRGDHDREQGNRAGLGIHSRLSHGGSGGMLLMSGHQWSCRHEWYAEAWQARLSRSTYVSTAHRCCQVCGESR